MTSRIICLSGIPGMGKSTYARQLGMYVVDVDNGEKFHSRQDNFIVDWIFLTASERTRCISEFRKLYPSATLELHWFKPNLDLIVIRRNYHLDQAKRFFDKYEIPTYEEGWDFIKEVQ